MKRLLAVLIALLLLAGGVRADITSNLVAHWKLDETSGAVAADSSGNGYTGTYVNTPTLGEAGAFGSSKAVTFASASSQYISFGSKAAPASMTVAFWQKFTSASGTQRPFHYGRTLISIATNGVVITWFSDTAGSFVNWTVSALGTTNFRHIAITQTGTTAILYIDGVSQGSKTISAAINTAANNSFVACYNGASQFINASLDDVRIYSRALSAADVAELYAYTGARFPYWYFNSSGCDPFKVFRTRQPLAIVTTR